MFPDQRETSREKNLVMKTVYRAVEAAAAPLFAEKGAHPTVAKMMQQRKGRNQSS